MAEKKNMRHVQSVCFAVVFLLSAAGSLRADDLIGRWLVRWDNDAKNENAMTLTARDNRLSGIYLNDSKATCTVTGNIDTKTKKFALTIVCPAWDIRMQGIQGANEASVSGSYQAYLDIQGKFTMRKM